MDPGDNKPRPVKAKVKVKGKAAPAAPAPAAAPPPNNNWLEDIDPFTELEGLILKGKIHEIKNFLKQQAKKKDKLEFITLDPKKGYTIWDVALFKGDPAIKKLLREASSTAQIGVMEKREEVYLKAEKAASPKNISEAITAYIEKEKRNAKEKANAEEAARAAAIAAAIAAETERRRLEQLARNEQDRKYKEELELYRKNEEAARLKLKEIIDANIEDPTNPAFLELLELFKQGIDLTKNVVDPNDPKEKITFLELITFLKDPLLSRLIQTLLEIPKNTYGRFTWRSKNQMTLKQILKITETMPVGSIEYKYRHAIKTFLDYNNYFRYSHEYLYRSVAPPRPTFRGKLSAVVSAANLFRKNININKNSNVKVSLFDKLYADKEKRAELQAIIDDIKEDPKTIEDALPYIENAIRIVYDGYGDDIEIEKIKYLLKNKIFPQTDEVFQFINDYIHSDEGRYILVSMKLPKEQYCRFLDRYPEYHLHRELVLKGYLDISDCKTTFLDRFSKLDVDYTSRDKEILQLLLNPKNINRVFKNGPLLSYILRLQFRSLLEHEFRAYDSLIKMFLQAGADINAPLSDGSSMLIYLQSQSIVEYILSLDNFNLEFHLKSLIDASKKQKLQGAKLTLLYELLLLYKTLHTSEETLARLESVPAATIQASSELKALRKALQDEIDAGKPYTGYSQSQLLLLNEMLYRPVDFSFCPVCLFATPRRDGCLYMRHDCRDSGVYHEELYEKYKDWQGKITWCTMCSRICDSWQTYSGVAHRHFQLVPYTSPKPAHSVPRLGLEDAFDKSCVNQGGGGLIEKFVRMRRFREFAFDVQDQVGKQSDKQVRRELIEEVWNSFTARQPAAQKVLNLAQTVGKEILNTASARLPKVLPTNTAEVRKRKEKAEIELTDEEIVRLNSIWQKSGLVPTSAFPKGNELTAANRMAIAAQQAANAKLNTNAKAASFPWSNAANATKQPKQVTGEFCNIHMDDDRPVWEFQHGIPMDTHGRICSEDLTDGIVNRMKTTSFRDENAVKCWSFPQCTHTLWPEEIRGKVPDDVYNQYKIYFNKFVLTHGGKPPMRGGRPPLDLEALPFFHTESPSAQCSLPIWSQVTITSKTAQAGGKTRKNRK